MHIPFTQVDAFASTPFEGNPAAIMPLADWLDDDTLQAVAAENNLSETAFLVPAEGNADFELRWFTPAAEVALCGHATLASGHVVLSSDPDRERVRFRTRQAGVLDVARDGEAYAMTLPAYRAEPRPLSAIVAALGLTDVVETLWHPRRYALVVVENEAAVRALRPDFRTLGRLSGRNPDAADGAEPDVLTIVTAPGVDTDVVSRVFAPGAGIDEDSVTGSAHAVMAPYWAGVLGRNGFTAYQASARGGKVGCTVEGERVILRGSCVTVIEGTFLLP